MLTSWDTWPLYRVRVTFWPFRTRVAAKSITKLVRQWFPHILILSLVWIFPLDEVNTFYQLAYLEVSRRKKISFFEPKLFMTVSYIHLVAWCFKMLAALQIPNRTPRFILMKNRSLKPFTMPYAVTPYLLTTSVSRKLIPEYRLLAR